jgi:hypothetical protein
MSTEVGTTRQAPAATCEIGDFDLGFLVGVLVGEGHFGGDGRQPQVTLRMHADHRSLFDWLMERFPESRLYGPYEHAGRRYYQWMARGPFLRERLMPLLRERLRPVHSARVWERYVAMCRDYGLGEPDPPDGAHAASAG